MDKEIEEEINKAIDKANNYLLWEIRKIAGEFPYRMRVACFFSATETRSMHFLEREMNLSQEHLDAFEGVFQKETKKDLVEEAAVS
jgi:hypothetical protein